MADRKSEDAEARVPESTFEVDNGDKEDDAFLAQPPSGATPARLSQSLSSLDNSPLLSVAAYCLSSISMTVVNKYVVSGDFWNLTFFYLAVQVCLHHGLVVAWH